MSFSSNKVKPNNISLDGAQTLSNKTLDSTNTIEAGATITTPDIINPNRLDPKRVADIAAAEAYAATAQNGELVYVEDIKKQFQVKDGALTEIAGGSSGINYIANSQFNEGINDVTGSANLAVSHETVAPLRGAGSLKINKAAIDASTQSVTIPFTIDKADLSQMLTISFDKDFSDANYADGHAQVRIIVDPDGAATTKRVEYGEDILGGKNSHLAQFQTDATELNYALAIYWNDNSTVAVEALVDNIVVGPRAVTKGAIVTETKEYTPTTSGTASFSLGNGTLEGDYARVGDRVRINVKLTFGSTTTIGTTGFLGFSLPSGITEAATVEARKPVGLVFFEDNGTVGNRTLGHAYVVGGFVYIQPIGGGDFPNSSPFTFVTNDVIAFNLEFAVQGWSSNAQMSEDLGGRDVSLQAHTSSTQTMNSSYADIVFGTTIKDTTSSYNSSTGVYTVPETGDYAITINGLTTSVAYSAGDVFEITIYDIDSSSDILRSVRRVQSSLTASFQIGLSKIIKLTKGQRIKVRGYYNGVTSLQNNSVYTNLSIIKLASPQTMFESATVAARYTSSNGQDVDNDRFIYENKDFDTHNAYDTSTGVYTAPVSGIYKVKFIFRPTNNGFSTGAILKNGSAYEYKQVTTPVAGITYDQDCIIKLEKGETTSLFNVSGIGNNATLTADGRYNTFSIIRIK